MRIPTGILLVTLLVAACSQLRVADESFPSVDGAAIKEHIQKLASDEMEGRAPGSKGEELATTYIADFFKSLGLKTEYQSVPMVGITSTASPFEMTARGSRKTDRKSTRLNSS